MNNFQYRTSDPLVECSLKSSSISKMVSQDSGNYQCAIDNCQCKEKAVWITGITQLDAAKTVAKGKGYGRQRQLSLTSGSIVKITNSGVTFSSMVLCLGRSFDLSKHTTSEGRSPNVR